MSIRKGIFKVRNTATGEKDEVMLKTTIEQVDDLDKLTGATANAPLGVSTGAGYGESKLTAVWRCYL